MIIEFEKVDPMIIKFKQYSPIIHRSSYLFPACQLLGAVHIKEYASVWPNAVLRADLAEIHLGCYSNIQDQATIHVEEGHPCSIGDFVTVGHQAIIHAATVHNNVLVGMGAILLNRCIIQKNCIIGAGSIITEGKLIEAGSLVLGIPGKVVRKLSDEEILSIEHSARRYQKLADQYVLRKEQLS
jgi:carbonic anhydrase/acetyltransferase-like protein (isoleucine patch superfamily)